MSYISARGHHRLSLGIKVMMIDHFTNHSPSLDYSSIYTLPLPLWCNNLDANGQQVFRSQVPNHDDGHCCSSVMMSYSPRRCDGRDAPFNNIWPICHRMRIIPAALGGVIYTDGHCPFCSAHHHHCDITSIYRTLGLGDLPWMMSAWVRRDGALAEN